MDSKHRESKVATRYSAMKEVDSPVLSIKKINPIREFNRNMFNNSTVRHKRIVKSITKKVSVVKMININMPQLKNNRLSIQGKE